MRKSAALVLLLLSTQATASAVEELCAERWPDDRGKRLGCLGAQAVSAAGFAEVLKESANDGTMRAILLACEGRFAPDYEAVIQCAIEQAESARGN